MLLCFPYSQSLNTTVPFNVFDVVSKREKEGNSGYQTMQHNILKLNKGTKIY